MFSTLGLFKSVPCPNGPQCERPQCVFSHLPGCRQPTHPHIPVNLPRPNKVTPKSNIASSSTSSSPSPSTISVKRALPASPASQSSNTASTSRLEPPTKTQKLDALNKRPTASNAYSCTTTGVPILKVNAAQSQVAVPVRQAMLKTLYEHFATLYAEILPTNPSLAAEHALAQEQDVYSSSTKLTYRNAVISSVAALKKRPKPDSILHDSVGTEVSLQRRKEQRQSLHGLRLTPSHLKPHLLSIEVMKQLEYITEIPDGPGGDNPSEEGKVKTCERCKQPVMIKRREEAEECRYHWGRPYASRINGEKVRVWSCCSRPTSEGEGCERGPHVFYESDPVLLHSRHGFTPTRPPIVSADGDTALEVVALDCEMIYTTAGMRVARVSVVDGDGKEVFDEIVKMDDGVEVIDFNTRFSGITDEMYSKAVQPLASIRRALDNFINTDTIIIGHALDNDLKTLRMIHTRCVDTVTLFPHRAGLPYRRALRELVREHLKEVIQAGGGSTGHSSVEDSIATLNLVRWYILNQSKSKGAAAITSAVSVLSG